MNRVKDSTVKRKSEQELFDTMYPSAWLDEHEMLPLGFLLQRAARLFPDRIVLIYEDKKITYHELFFRAVLLSKTLTDHNVCARDRVLLLFENSIEFYIAYFAIVQVGAIVAPINTFLTEHELSHIINDAQPKLIIASSVLAERLNSINDATPLPHVLTESAIDLTSEVPDSLPSIKHPGLKDDEMAVLLYTSGTTGLPKGVMLSSKNIMTNLIQGIARFGFVKEERVFGVLPLFHSFAQGICVWASIFLGCTVILVPKIDRRYILQGLKHQPTIFFGVPALYGLLCLLKNAPVASVEYFFSGGDALPDKIRSAFALVYRRKICSGYGMTETSPVISVDLDDITSPTDTVGQPLIGIEYKVTDEKGAEVVEGQVGELLVKGDNVMLGYYNEPAMTREVLHDGWLRTGDLVYVDTRGKFVITGRIKDLIIHKGLNIYPQEIENVILIHPNVIRVGVIGSKDTGVGEVPIAYVQLRKDEHGMEKALKQLCLKNLAAYKLPRAFICITRDLPTTATGKVDKKVLRKQYAQRQ